MADLISYIQDEMLDDADEGVFDQGDSPSFSITDDSISSIHRMRKVRSNDRDMVPHRIVEAFKTCSPDLISKDLPDLMDYFLELAERDDDIFVKIACIRTVPNIAATASLCAAQAPALSAVVPNYILPLIVHNLNACESIRTDTLSALFSLLDEGLISKVQVEIKICPTILALSQMDNVKDCSVAITLMSKLTTYLGRDVTERVFLDRFVRLCSNTSYCVRNECASHFGKFCNVVSQTTFNNVLLPCFIKLCSDENWGVRKSCAEVIMSVSCSCTLETRRSVLAPILVKLLQDVSRWVCLAAFQVLGPFISTFSEGFVLDQSYEMVLVNVPDYKTNEFINGYQSHLPPHMNLTDLFLHERDAEDKNRWEESDNSPKNCDNVEVNEEVIETETVEIENGPEDDKDLTTSDPSDIKEIIDTVKNAVLIFRNDSSVEVVDNNLNKSDENENVTKNLNLKKLNVSNDLDLQNKEVNNEDTSKINSCSESVENTVVEDENRNGNDGKGDAVGEDEDHLKEFNSYNYWYVKPDLPVDPSIVTVAADDAKEKKKNGNMPRHLNIIADLVGEKTFSTLFSIPVTSSGLPVLHSIKVTDDECLGVVPKYLVDFYVSMTDPDLAQCVGSDLAYFCAYSLPAVVLTLGKKHWHLLQSTLEKLASHMQYKVRRTVASSLHELAIILGPEITTENLAPIFDEFIKDLDEVRIEMLKHMAHFLKMISPHKRVLYMSRLSEFLQTDNATNWRFRFKLVNQLLQAIPLFDPFDFCTNIFAIAEELLCDKVAAVREVTIHLVTEILRYVHSNPKVTHSWLLFILADKFAHSKKWRRRQSFALLCAKLLATNAIGLELFSSEVMPHLLDLSWDPVANVRIVVARTISKHIVTEEHFMDSSNQQNDIQSVLRRLQADKDRDVRHCANCQIAK